MELIDIYEDGGNILEEWTRLVRMFPKTTGGLFSKEDVRKHIEENKIALPDGMELYLSTKPTRTISGVAPITIFTKPYQCSGHCIFCPTAVNAPKSYLPEEPGVQRAIELNYQPFEQVKFRTEVFKKIGHEVDKIELIISGGTWDDYPANYRMWYMLEVFRALNREISMPFSENINYLTSEYFKELWSLQQSNAQGAMRAVGITVETRPDKISAESLSFMRRLGVTKIQIGIQSLDDHILKLNKRGHTVQQSIDAANMIRLAGFKIHVHWMANLYGSNAEKDFKDFKRLWTYVKPDELKIYPCSIVENTALYHLYKKGEFKPYTTEELIKLIAKCKTIVPEYCRITRVFRDIPSNLIVDGNKYTNLREMVHQYMQKHNQQCKCIRCNEVRDSRFSKPIPKEITFKTDISTEHFLYYTNAENQILGFLRLSIYNQSSLLLNVQSMIREIHVYGRAQRINSSSLRATQHLGIGRLLIQRAEDITKQAGLSRIAVISGVGTREYYIKQGFDIEENWGYGVKKI